MRKLYTLLVASMITCMSYGQGMVTFEVDMNNTTASVDGVHLAGSFADSGYPEWSPNGIVMDDIDTDGVYSVTLDLVGAYYEFKIINGNDWPFEGDVPNACQVEVNGNSNRFVNVSGDMTVHFCFESCAPCGMNAARFRVDMSQELEVNPLGVHVGGNFQGWNPGGNMLTDANADMVYEAIIVYDPASLVDDGGDLLFKYINGNDWIFPTESAPAECGDGTGNRLVEVTETNQVMDAVCFNLCGPCVAPTMVTFNVDMSNETVPAEGVFIAGAFQGWSAGQDEMTDPDEDNIYSITLPLAPSTYEYKFILGADGWEALPAGCAVNNNRQIIVEEEEVSVTYCYNQCEVECVMNPDPADITFRVNMADAGASVDGVWVMGNFTDPVWQDGAIEMTDADSDDIYEATVEVSGSAEFQYKFVNGDVTVPANEEAAGIELCGVENGLGGFNRVHVRSGSDEVLDIVCFDACADCGVSVNEIEHLNAFNLYPNPVESVLTINIQLSEVMNVNLRVLNTLGQEIKSVNLGTLSGQSSTELDVSDLKSGIYSLELNNSNARVSKHFVVK